VSHAKHDLAQRNNPPYQKYAQSEDEKCQGGERNCRLPIADLAPLNFARLVEKSKTYEEHRSVKLKDFFGETHLLDIKPMMIEKFKRQRLATPIKHDKENRPRLRSPAIVNRDL